MSFKLQSSPEQLRIDFLDLETPQDVADLLDVSYRDLNYYLYRIGDNKYFQFEIPRRSGGLRIISSPIVSLKILQSKLNQVLSSIYEPQKCVHGFVPLKSIVSNASVHKKQKYVLNLDLKDFFSSINFGRVRGMFIAHPYNLPSKVATVLAQICCFNNSLPQGAPSSPIVSNMICSKLDSKLKILARENKCFYTRYADDITFSTSIPLFPSKLAVIENNNIILGNDLLKIIEEEGFLINFSKIRLQTIYDRQEVTGIIVNRFPNVDRRYIRQIRAMLHDWDINGIESAGNRHFHRNPNAINPNPKKTSQFGRIIRGKIEYVGMVRGKEDSLYLRLYNQYQYLLRREYKESDIANREVRIFISYARADDGFAKKLRISLDSIPNMGVWIDINNIPPGANWSTAVQEGLQICNVMVLVLTQRSLESRNVEDEWQYFHDQNKLIIPLWVKNFPEEKISFQLSRLQRIDFRNQNNYNDPLKRLKDRLLKFQSESTQKN